MIKLHTDSYFHIGQTHLGAGKPCQDYATSGMHNDVAYAVVADGCSTGGATDVGSRVLALSTATAIEKHFAILAEVESTLATAVIGIEQRSVSKSVRSLLGLKLEDMLSTCAYACLSKDNGFMYMQGDGVFALKMKYGSIRMFRFEWEENMPFYPAYAEESIQAFVNAHGGERHLACVKATVNTRDEQGKDFSGIQSNYTIEEGMKGLVVEIPPSLLNDLEFVAIFSDGVTQIDGVDWKDVVSDLMSFKNTKGAFAKRRMIRGIKDMQKVGKGPLDDISYAVIHIDQSEEENDDEATQEKCESSARGSGECYSST